MTAYPKHHFRVQGYVEPETFAILFDDRYPTWGAQTRIVKALLGALAKHVATYCDPHLPTHERDNELDDILAGVTFGRPLRSRGDRNGPRAATRASGQHPAEASEQAVTAPRLTDKEWTDALARVREHPDAHARQASREEAEGKEAQAEAAAR